MKTSTFHARLESLERRETPSTHALAAHVAVPVSGTGTGQVTSYNMTGKNTYAVTGSLNGSDNLGAFQGNATARISLRGSGSGTAVLTDNVGDTVRLRFNGRFANASGTDTLRGRFVTTGVTGPVYNGATGSGTVLGTLDTTTGQITFSFSGRARV